MGSCKTEFTSVNMLCGLHDEKRALNIMNAICFFSETSELYVHTMCPLAPWIVHHIYNVQLFIAPIRNNNVMDE